MMRLPVNERGHPAADHFTFGIHQNDIADWTGRKVRLSKIDEFVSLIGNTHSSFRRGWYLSALNKVLYQAAPVFRDPSTPEICPAAQLVT